MIAGNAPLALDESLPYDAVYGQRPSLRPDSPGLIDDGTDAGTLKSVARLRGISIQHTVDGTAKARPPAIMGNPHGIVGQSRGYMVGDIADFHRAMGTTYARGWARSSEDH